MVARVLGSLGIKDAPRQMRRLFGPCGGAARHDAVAATDVDVNLNDEDDFAAWTAHRHATLKSGKGKRRTAKRDGEGIVASKEIRMTRR